MNLNKDSRWLRVLTRKRFTVGRVVRCEREEAARRSDGSLMWENRKTGLERGQDHADSVDLGKIRQFFDGDTADQGFAAFVGNELETESPEFLEGLW